MFWYFIQTESINTAVFLPVTVKVSSAFGAGNGHFCNLQTTANDVRKAEKTYTFLPEMQSKVTNNYNNSSGTRVYNMGFWVDTLLKNDEDAQKVI